MAMPGLQWFKRIEASLALSLNLTTGKRDRDYWETKQEFTGKRNRNYREMKQEKSSLYREMKQETIIQHPGLTHEFSDCTCMKN
jgi:hypothetical protein